MAEETDTIKNSDGFTAWPLFEVSEDHVKNVRLAKKVKERYTGMF